MHHHHHHGSLQDSEVNQEAKPEVKPEVKPETHINLKVSDGSSEIFFKIKKTTPLRRLMEAFAKRQGKEMDSLTFLYDGIEIQADQTPEDLDMEDNDIIEAHREQIGGKKLVVITGASSGIGEAIARRFSEEGHPLLLLARRVERLKALNLPNTLCAQVDVTDKNTFDAAITRAEKIYGPADAIVNNAGMMLLGQIDTQEANEWQRMFDVNVLGLLNGMQAVLAPMKARNCGTIINISSIAGKKTFPDHAAYCGTKFAVHAISENVREEVAASNVRVTTIAPSAVKTELLSHTTSQQIKDGYDAWKVDMGGVLAADDVARAVLFAYQQPQNVCIREIALAPTKQQP